MVVSLCEVLRKKANMQSILSSLIASDRLRLRTISPRQMAVYKEFECDCVVFASPDKNREIFAARRCLGVLDIS